VNEDRPVSHAEDDPAARVRTPPLRTQVSSLARRSVVRTLRQPVLLVPNLIFPLFLLAVLSGAGDQITKVKGFPTTSYITFVLGATLIQCGVGAMTVAGNGLGNDIETGFLSRLSLTPTQGYALVFGQLAGVALTACLQGVLVLGVGLAAGASIEAGVAGALVLIAVVLVTVLAFGAIGQYAALRTGSSEAVQGLFPIALAALFLSSMVMPRNLIQEDWFRTVATYNPVSYLVEAARSLLISGWDGEALALGFGLAGATAIVATTATVIGIRRKLA
jgi:ABC-2 type transport system permease protein